MAGKTGKLIFLSTAVSMAASLGFAGQEDSRTSPKLDNALAKEVMTLLKINPSRIESLHNGEVLYTGMPDLEKLPEELSVVGAVLLIRRSLEEVAHAFVSIDSFAKQEAVIKAKRLSHGPQGIVPSEFAPMSYTKSESKEVERLTKVRPGDTFNLSTGEMSRFRSIDSGSRAAGALAASFYRAALTERYRSYLEKGSSGIEPYARKGGKETSPGLELKTAIESTKLLEEYYPWFRRSLLEFPAGGSDKVEEGFFWVKVDIEGRPAFLLVRNTHARDDGIALLAEQFIYTGHTLNSLLALTGAVKYGSGTLVFGANMVFTDQVTGFMSGVKHSVGRKRVAKQLAEHFEGIRADVEALSPEN